MATVPTGYLGDEANDEELKYETFVYLIGAVGRNRIKVGKADDPSQRLRQLQTGSAEQLQLLGVIKAKASFESDLQLKFAEDRIRGEWFEATNDLRSYIEQYAADDG